MERGYIKLHRRIQGHWLWEKPYSPVQAWLEVVMRANWQDTQIIHGGEVVTLHRGEFLASTRSLAKDFGWSKDKVTRWLKKARQHPTPMLHQTRDGKRDSNGAIYLVVKYDTYNPLQDGDRDSKRDSDEDSNEDSGKDKQKISKKQNNKTYPQFDAFWDAYPRRVGKKAAEKAYAKAITGLNGTEDPHGKILRAVQTYAAEVTDPKFIAHPTTWLNGGRWDDEPDDPRNDPDVMRGVYIAPTR